MRKTWKEIQISKCIKIGNKYRTLKPLMLFLIVLIVLLEDTRLFFMNNRKRLLGVMVSFLVFMVSNSFSAPVFQSEDELSGLEEQEVTQLPENEEAYFEEKIETILEEDALNASEDKYSVDEILKNTTVAEYASFDSNGGEEKKFSKDDWNLLLVNKQHPVPEDYTFELGTIAGSMKCDARILPDLFAMLQAAKEEGVYLVICSPYRDISRQEILFNRKIKNYMGNGDSYMEAYKKASQIVTVPGASEHQIGLALDIISNDYKVLNEGFENTMAGKWLKEHSREYGFILRYPRGKEHITGIDYEPWHFRYVGKEAATYIMDNEITLEEFIESISE